MNKQYTGKNFKLQELREPELLYAAKSGVSPSYFYSFAEAVQIPEQKLAGLLHLSSRTIKNYSEQKKKLGPVPSEHLLRLVSLYAKGGKIFGSQKEFGYWLQKPSWNIKETPADWLDTPGGVEMVHREIDRMAEGYPV